MRSRRTFHLAWRTRIVACLAVLWVVFGAGTAGAATLVPMCGEHAETVIAPPVSRPASDAVLRAPCSQRAAVQLSDGAPEAPREPMVPHEAAPRILPVYYRLAPIPCTRAALEVAPRGDRAGFGSAIERPPRRRAL